MPFNTIWCPECHYEEDPFTHLLAAMGDSGDLLSSLFGGGKAPVEKRIGNACPKCGYFKLLEVQKDSP